MFKEVCRRMREGREGREGEVRHAYYRVRYALHVHLGKNDFPMVGCSRRYVGDERREREVGERSRRRKGERRKGKVRGAL